MGEVEQLGLKQHELTNIIINLDTKVTVLADMEEQLGDVQETADLNAEVQAQQKVQIEDFEKNKLKPEGGRWEDQQAKLQDDLENKSRELQRMMLRINELGVGYVPVRNDLVDQALAELIDEQPPAVPFF